MERRVDGQLVSGDVDRSQAGQGVDDLGTLEEAPAALDAIGDPGVAQRVLVVLDAGERAQKDRDVAETRRAARDAPYRPPEVVESLQAV